MSIEVKELNKELNDEAIHDFVILDNMFIVQRKFYKCFDVSGTNLKHGSLVVEDDGRIVIEGCNFPEEELSNFSGEIVII